MNGQGGAEKFCEALPLVALPLRPFATLELGRVALPHEEVRPKFVFKFSVHTLFQKCTEIFQKCLGPCVYGPKFPWKFLPNFPLFFPWTKAIKMRPKPSLVNQHVWCHCHCTQITTEAIPRGFLSSFRNGEWVITRGVFSIYGISRVCKPSLNSQESRIWGPSGSR